MSNDTPKKQKYSQAYGDQCCNMANPGGSLGSNESAPPPAVGCLNLSELFVSTRLLRWQAFCWH